MITRPGFKIEIFLGATVDLDVLRFTWMVKDADEGTENMKAKDINVGAQVQNVLAPLVDLCLAKATNDVRVVTRPLPPAPMGGLV